MAERYDLIVVGSGPAGLSAAIYAQRARLNTIVIEKAPMSGGQILNTDEVDNYPGLPGISGFDLGMKLREHADKLEARFVEDDVLSLNLDGDWKRVICDRGTYEARALILATGATHKKLGIPGEERLTGAGVSYCATCDGAFFRNKVTAVVGGGDVALGDAIFLARMCQKVYLIHRRDQFRGAKSLQKKIEELDNVEVIWDTVVDEIQGERKVETLLLGNRKTGVKSSLPVDGVFMAVGISPNTQAFSDSLTVNEQGYIVAEEDGVTSASGVFAAGDARTKALRQIVTAVSDGANCVTSVEIYLTGK